MKKKNIGIYFFVFSSVLEDEEKKIYVYVFLGVSSSRKKNIYVKKKNKQLGYCPFQIRL